MARYHVVVGRMDGSRETSARPTSYAEAVESAARIMAGDEVREVGVVGETGVIQAWWTAFEPGEWTLLWSWQ